MKYDDTRGDLKTGDIVLFSGNGAISTIIKYASRSPWSHVGMVVLAGDMVLLWESTTLSNLRDAESGQCVQGVQLVGLRERLAGYDGAAGLRRLNGNLSGRELHDLAGLRSELAGRAYEENRLELLGAIASWDNEEDLSSLFCSELVAAAYQHMGLLTRALPSNEYTPRDFAGDLALEEGYSLGETMELSI